jgi:hypothetical protein
MLLGGTASSVSALVTQLIETYFTERTPDRSIGEILINTGVSAGIGAALGWLTKPIPLPNFRGRAITGGVGSGSYEHSFKLVIGQHIKGRVRNIRWRTIRNGFVYMGFSDIAKAIVYGIIGSNISQRPLEWFSGIFSNFKDLFNSDAVNCD